MYRHDYPHNSRLMARKALRKLLLSGLDYRVISCDNNVDNFPLPKITFPVQISSRVQNYGKIVIFAHCRVFFINFISAQLDSFTKGLYSVKKHGNA